jgi:hypothetical protein
MNDNEYKYYLADDHKGNKALFVTKGHIRYEDLVGENVNKISDPKFEPLAQQLRKIINETTVAVTEGGGNHANN